MTCFQAEAEWIDVDSPMNVSWSIIPILKKNNLLKKHVDFLPFSLTYLMYLLLFLYRFLRLVMY